MIKTVEKNGEEDIYLAHEALDRAVLISDNLYYWIIEHPEVVGSKGATKAAKGALSCLQKLVAILSKKVVENEKF